MSSSEHCRRAIFQIYNVQNLKITRITTFRTCNVVYQAGSRRDPKCFFFNFLRFFERTLYKSNYRIFILSWCGTHTKIRSKLVDIITAGSQKITLWGPQRTSLGILRVNPLKTGRNYFSTQSSQTSERALLFLGVSQTSRGWPSGESNVWMKMKMEHWWDYTDRGNPGPVPLFPPQISWTDLGSNSVLLCERPA